MADRLLEAAKAAGEAVMWGASHCHDTTDCIIRRHPAGQHLLDAIREVEDRRAKCGHG